MSKTNRACTNCVRAKAKCSPNVNGTEKCERCLRLNKECIPSAPMRKRRPGSSVAAGKVQALEAKLDSLASLLQTQTLHTLPQALQTPASTSSQPTGQPGQPAESADQTLALFNRLFLFFFPLVRLENTTAAQLQQERPLLWAAISAVATPCVARQRSLSLQMREVIAREAYVKGTCSLDFFNAVTVFAVWDRHRNHNDALLTNLMQQAVASIYELGLHEPPPSDPGLILSYDIKGIPRPSRMTRAETVEERRALLSCYLLSGRNQSLRWTAYFDECLAVLEGNEDDLLLCQLVRLRLLAETAHTAWSGVKHTSDLSSAMLHLRSLKHQLQVFRDNIPPQLLQNKPLLLQLHDTEVTVHEIGLREIFSPGTTGPRVAILLELMQAAHRWADVFLTLQPAELYGMPFSALGQMNRCLVVGFRLNAIDWPGWDRNLFREQLDVPRAFDHIMTAFGRVKDEVPLDTQLEMDVFSVLAAKMTAKQPNWEAELGYLPSFWDFSFDELTMEMF
ncbi:hypothetical protein ASPZODRAFT_142635 [Penicilliopsis zonata CBS 506.65]|uniref:Zn(2)-C6 fungal-type domain-containing protein n=1 Tax=Penicilliopsis zonata CBS 506.65 TaxID=1073090 RepID=A0A1L9SFV2_9EURO|nr:hypothetical protein ASPZODRAFT_142635 [Penicilliopsis zonata CBS 506.65]OJJ45998.1 hypothetical protein ASPZODRAFT_142635 [Penicilliopsis zonata CBS 506.65]